MIYGASECLVGTATSPYFSSQEQLMNSIGYPFPHTEVRLSKCLYPQTFIKIIHNILDRL